MSDTAQGGYLMIGRQTAKGAAAVPTHGLRLNDVNVSGQSELLIPDAEIGGGRNIDSPSVAAGGFKVQGDLTGLLRTKNVGLLLMAAGLQPAAPVAEAGATGAIDHTFTPGALTYLTLETSWGANRLVRRAVDCLIDELTISVTAGGQAEIEASFVGVDEVYQASPGSPVYETDPVPTWYGSAITFDALATYRFTEMSLAIANNLSDDEWKIGSRKLDDVTAGRREVTFEGTIKLGDNSPSVTDLYRAAVWGAKAATTPGLEDPYHTAATLTFGSRKLIGTSVAKRYGIDFALPDVVLEGFPLEASGEDVVEASIKAHAVQGGAALVTATLRNAHATNYNVL